MEDKVSDTNLALSRLLEMIEIVKAELFLIELLNYKANMMVLAKGRISAFHQGLQFFREFGKLILTHIEAVVRLAGSCYNSCVADRINEDILFKLFKAQLFLMVLLDSNNSLITKDETDKLYEGLIVLREFLTDVPEDNLVEGKLKVIEALATARHLQFARSSLSNCPKTGVLGFIDFLLGNLRELLTHRADSIACVDYQIEVLLRELDFLRFFLWADADQDNGHRELKDHSSCVTDVAYEAEYVIGSFEVKDGPICCLVSWLFDAIEVIKTTKAQVTEIYARKINDVLDHNVAKTLRHTKIEANTPTIHEVVVALNDQAEGIINQLTGALYRWHAWNRKDNFGELIIS